jgi:hypothetical protein
MPTKFMDSVTIRFAVSISAGSIRRTIKEKKKIKGTIIAGN